MIEGPGISDDSLKGIVAGYCVVAGLITVFRFSVRSPKKWWWDELCTFLGLLAIILQTVVLWLRFDHYPPLVRNKTAMLAAVYLNGVCFYIEDWGARCAILFSIIRITAGERIKRYLKLVAFGFFVLFCINVTVLFVTCEEDPKWHERNPPRCILTQVVPIFRIITGILSDALLVIIPVYNLKQLKTAPAFRRALMIIFGSSAWLTAACIAQAAVTIRIPGDPQMVASMTEGFIALLLCNLSVVVVAIINICGYNPTIVSQGVHRSFELSTVLHIRTVEEILRDTESRCESVRSLKKVNDGEGILRTSGFLTRWRTMNIDVDDASCVALNDRDIEKGAA